MTEYITIGCLGIDFNDYEVRVYMDERSDYIFHIVAIYGDFIARVNVTNGVVNSRYEIPEGFLDMLYDFLESPSKIFNKITNWEFICSVISADYFIPEHCFKIPYKLIIKED